MDAVLDKQYAADIKRRLEGFTLWAQDQGIDDETIHAVSHKILTEFEEIEQVYHSRVANLEFSRQRLEMFLDDLQNPQDWLRKAVVR